MKNVVLFGIGQFSETVSAYLALDPDITIVGYTVDAAYQGDVTEFLGKPVIPWEQLETRFPPQDVLLFGPISFRDGNRFRRDRFLDGKARGYRFLTYIHPDASIMTDQIGENCLILEKCILQPCARIGDNVIIWSANHIGHHSRIDDHCFIAGQVAISGSCHVQELTFFGGQSGLSDNCTVGAGCIIGFGAAILTDLAADSVVMRADNRVIDNAARRFAKRLL